MKHKRMLTVVFSLILALTLSICSVFADNFSSPELPSDEELLTLVEDSVNAYKKQYIIHSVDIANKCIQSTSQNGYTVDFTVALDVELIMHFNYHMCRECLRCLELMQVVHLLTCF